MEDDHQELQLLPTPQTLTPSSSSNPSSTCWPSSSSSSDPATIKLQSAKNPNPLDGPSLDLQLSISFRTIRPKPVPSGKNNGDVGVDDIEALKWQAAEQIRLAAMEKAYAERVRELSRREMELAQAEFARARSMWARAREEVEKAEILKERATRTMDATCMEISCNTCRQKFRP